MNDHGTLLAVVLDLSPAQWHRAANDPQPITLNAFLAQLLAFLNAHIACMHENTLAVFGAFPGKSVMLYASTDQHQTASISVDANSYPPFKLLDNTVVTSIAAELDALDDSHDEEEVPCALVGALTKALCSTTPLPNGSQGVPPQLDPRILILSVSPDLSTSYIPIMNAIFSAQKLKVTIDACQIYGGETVFLQQAAHLTGGSYLLLERRDALLQYLTSSASRVLFVAPAGQNSPSKLYNVSMPFGDQWRSIPRGLRQHLVHQTHLLQRPRVLRPIIEHHR
ncbi:basic transcription factor 2.35KD subunit [Coprinopsis cinerea okayama7|uniref:General transcription and DNA repair factor IIH subunit TFB4 n=1 Tax=Coprinopsis cinerea (strain Okayama-7 / 130 / ATCC MYA-4618 / FGSC 9003) TaxID=240176 RepID=A8N5A1_COPC7|nr:basic transcription factor 2.35KD subunit [Coprinopsis cinerea okayama7\|eukprot:XP_001830046.2 basic transcription factor 2.35KD subunit [Coprinopsis cinerea okayama7\